MIVNIGQEPMAHSQRDSIPPGGVWSGTVWGVNCECDGVGVILMGGVWIGNGELGMKCILVGELMVVGLRSGM